MHGDWAGRQYCGRKIRKLRANVNLQQTKGRKYIAKPVTAENASTVKYAQCPPSNRHPPKLRLTTKRSLSLRPLLVRPPLPSLPTPVFSRHPPRVSSALLIVLFQAERDWAFAMALKRDVAEEPRKRFHVIKRMRRAAEHAARLATLCEALGPRCTSRTLLGAQAYRHYLDGLVHLETQHWQNALDALIQARCAALHLAFALYRLAAVL